MVTVPRLVSISCADPVSISVPFSVTLKYFNCPGLENLDPSLINDGLMVLKVGTFKGGNPFPESRGKELSLVKISVSSPFLYRINTPRLKYVQFGIKHDLFE